MLCMQCMIRQLSLSELILGRKFITPFQRLVIVVDSENTFMCHCVDNWIKEAQVQFSKMQKRKVLSYNIRRMGLEINVGNFVLLKKNWL